MNTTASKRLSRSAYHYALLWHIEHEVNPEWQLHVSCLWYDTWLGPTHPVIWNAPGASVSASLAGLDDFSGACLAQLVLLAEKEYPLDMLMVDMAWGHHPNLGGPPAKYASQALAAENQAIFQAHRNDLRGPLGI